MGAYLKTLLGDDFEIRTNNDPVDPLAKFLERVELRKNASPVLDESWNSPMGDIAQECFDKAVESAVEATRKFIDKYGQRAGTADAPWSELLKSFREERSCRL
jgi:hypothetical protein